MEDINDYTKDKILFKKTFNVSNKDIFEAHVNLYRSSFQWILTLLWAVITYFALFGYFDVLTAVIFIPALFIGLFFFTRVVTPLALLMYPPWRKGRIGEHTITLKEKEFIEQTEYNQTSIAWNYIEYVYVRSKSLSVRFGSEFFYIHQRNFTDEEWDTLKRILKNKVENKKYKILKMGALKFIAFVLLGVFSFLVLISMTLGIQVMNQKLPDDVKKELRTFHQESHTLESLTFDDARVYDSNKSMQIIDKYLKTNNVENNISIVKKVDDNSSFSCIVPQKLQEIYHWKDGVKSLIPYHNLLSHRQMIKHYEKFKEEQDDENRNYVPFIVEDESYGLSYHCLGEKGIYAYDPYGYEKPEKLYYGFAHFLEVTAVAYKEKAYYYEYGNFHTDEKRLANIKRRYLSTNDTFRYQKRIKLYTDKMLVYTKGSDSILKTMLIEKMGNTYNENIIDLIKVYLKDDDEEIVRTAIYALGKVGNETVLPTLYEYLEHNDETLRNFALLSISSLVNKDDKEVLKKIYPLLEDNSQLVVLSALEVVDRVANVSSVPILIELFDSKENAEQLKIVQILGKIGDVKALPLLEKHLRHANSLDFSSENKGGFRGHSSHPSILKREVEKAIEYVSK